GRAALDADPASIPARLSLARVLEAAGQAPAAEALLRTPPALRQPVVMRALIGLVQRQRGIEAALAVVADLPTGEAEEAAAVALLHGDLLLQARRPQEAAALYAEAGARWPATLFALREAMAREAAGESAAALRVLDRWLDAQPQDAAALSMRAQFAIAAEDWALAIRLLDVAVRVSPLDAVALNNLAWLLARDEAQPPEDRAEALAERAYYLMPNRQTADTLGWILFRRGDARRAVPLLRIAAADDDPASRLRLARALEAGREPLEALRQLEALPVAALPPRDRLIAEALRAQLGAGR
ncbi:tetratricopeptide repeat protein, partial [Roseomonas terrae]|nr:tetratricopeptide repeat protein [Neoroseomonas terrae]